MTTGQTRKQITRDSMLEQLRPTGVGHPGYDIPAIVDEIIELYGLVDVRDIPARGILGDDDLKPIKPGYHDILESHDTCCPPVEHSAHSLGIGRPAGRVEELQAVLAARRATRHLVRWTADEAGAHCITRRRPNGVSGATYRRYVLLSGAPDAVERDVKSGAKLYDPTAVLAWNATRPGQGARTDLKEKQ